MRQGLSLFIFAFLTAFIIHASPVSAGLIRAESCSQEDVQSAVEMASDGDTVLIPAGVCSWSRPVNVGRIASWSPLTYQGKSLVIAGAGIGKTVIRDATTGESRNEPLMIFCSSDDWFRVTGMTFRDMKKSSSTEKAIAVEGSCQGRIDHCEFDVSSLEPGNQGSGVRINSRVLVDNCIFNNTYTSVVVMGEGDTSWRMPQALGSAEAAYIESNIIFDSMIVGDGATDAYGGARYVFRHNNITNARGGHHGLDSGGYRSPHSFEVYENRWIWTVHNSWYTWRSRGGTGVIFNNSISGPASETQTFGAVNYRTCCCSPEEYAAGGCSCTIPPCHSNCGSWGRCDGNNPRDGNLDSTGYPCLDQPGRTTDMDGDGIQDLSPMYEWGNTINGKDADISVSIPWDCQAPSMTDHIKENRDFYNDLRKPGYTPYTFPHPMREPVCGDWLPELPEECDDGNTIPGDGCDSSCMQEGVCRPVSMPELKGSIAGWQEGIISLTSLMQKIADWKRGC
jgi:cysteine-rich repeat protein